MYLAGGQQRTITCSCGWSCKKAVRDANSAYKRHKKYCEIAKGIVDNPTTIPFNKETARNNGSYKNMKQDAPVLLGQLVSNYIKQNVILSGISV